MLKCEIKTLFAQAGFLIVSISSHFLYRVSFHGRSVIFFLQNFLPSLHNPLVETEFDLFDSELILHWEFSVANKPKEITY